MSSGRTATVRWLPAADLDDLWEGDLREVVAGGERVLLAHLPGGELRAYQARCPHQELPLADGDLDGTVLTCAAHLWAFDLQTREGVNPPGCALYRFPVRREGDRVEVGIPSDGLRHHHRCRE